MKRLLMMLAVGAALNLPVTLPAGAVDIHIGIPAPPRVYFERQPEVRVIPRSHVYYVPAAPEYDMYRYGGYWYVNQGGYWYRAHDYNGDFAAVDYRYVPHAIIAVPAEYRRHPLYHGHGHGHGHVKHRGHHRW